MIELALLFTTAGALCGGMTAHALDLRTRRDLVHAIVAGACMGLLIACTVRPA